MTEHQTDQLLNRKCAELLELAHSCGALTYGDFTLASGQKSSFYFDGRALTMSKRGLPLIVELFATVIRKLEIGNPVDGVGGPAVGSVPIVGALAYELALNAFFVRPEQKQHGARKLIEGALSKGSSVVVVEDTVTTGGSLLHTINSLQEYGCRVALALVVLDRGGVFGSELKQLEIPYFTALQATSEGKLTAATIRPWS